MDVSAALTDLTPDEVDLVTKGAGELIACSGVCNRKSPTQRQLNTCAACNRLYVHPPGNC
jgi:hypothetical protein